MIYPQKFEQKICFDIVRQNIKNKCVNSLAYKYVEQISFLNNHHAIAKQLQYSNEMFDVLENNINVLPIYEINDFREIFKKTEIDGTFFETNTVFSLKKLLDNIAQIVDFFSTKKRDDLPLLKRYVDGIVTFPNIQLEISKILDKNGCIKDSATPELAQIRANKHKIQNSVSKTLQRILQKAQQDEIVDKDASPVIRDGRLVIPVLSMNKRRIEGIIHDESASGKTFYVEPAQVVLLNNKLRELESDERKEIVKILRQFTSYTRPYYSDIIHSQKRYLGLDALNAIAKYSIEIGAICPTVDDDCIVDWQKARHPILEDFLKRQNSNIVPLNIALNQKDRILIISGANAGGKSVCIKTVCLLQYMLQCGLPIPVAESSRCGVFDSIFLDIGDGQNIEDDLSTYSSHLQNMKVFLLNATNKTLIAIDEFGGGTEPTIGGAIAEAILSEFCTKEVMGVITTHYTNLKYFAEQTEGVVNGAMLYDKGQLKPLFQLKIGQAGSSFAFEIAQNIGLPKYLIANAKDLVGDEAVNYDRLTQKAMKSKVYWERKSDKIRLQAKKQDEIIERYNNKLADIERQKQEIIQQAKKEAQSIVAGANAVIEGAIRQIKESKADKEHTAKARAEVSGFAKKIIPKNNELKNSVAQTNTLKVGDSVVIKGQQTVGQIIELNEKKAIVAFGGIKTSTKVAMLEYVSNNKAKRVNKAHLSKTTINSIRQRQLHFSQEIDVRGMRVSEALQAVMYYIDDAEVSNVERVRILHGTGEGALRQAIRDYLATRRSVKSFADEHIQLGGAGITVVNFG